MPKFRKKPVVVEANELKQAAVKAAAASTHQDALRALYDGLDRFKAAHPIRCACCGDPVPDEHPHDLCWRCIAKREERDARANADLETLNIDHPGQALGLNCEYCKRLHKTAVEEPPDAYADA